MDLPALPVPLILQSPERELVGVGAPAIRLDLRSLPGTPRGPAARLEGAAREAWGTACALREQWLDQRGIDPLLLVCAVDCFLGRQLVERNLGPSVPQAVSGPVVFAVDFPQIESALGASGAKAIERQLLELKAQAGEMVLLFAVNGSSIDLRVARTPAPAKAAKAIEELVDGAPPPLAPAPPEPPSGEPFSAAKLPSQMAPAELAAARAALEPPTEALFPTSGAAA